ncbi:hypothetical protein [Vibrio sp. vnigr-6D03]|uniref:hypothetical protein n=1 Tax=Vibrio sp. vnigr-6D03 TaxID=2058088 RepID=UPI001F2D03A0|nr:hypothetical protein [Vibrio sp. vnigr-6D03]
MSLLGSTLGGWSNFRKLNLEDKAVFNSALEGFVGVNYEPMEVQSQVVAGVNYRYLCKANLIDEPTLHYFSWVSMFAPLDGKPYITNIQRIEEPKMVESQKVDQFELVSLKASLRNNAGESAEDVLGFERLVRDGNECYQYYQAERGVGLTHATQVICPLGLAIIEGYKFDYKQAIEVFYTGNWGSKFIKLSLSKVLSPEVKEPVWTFVSDLGTQVQIGADTGEILKAVLLEKV